MSYVLSLSRVREYMMRLNGRDASGTRGIVAEFNALNTAATEAWLDKSVTVARKRANRHRNRYTNVHPYDDNLVTLQPRADDPTSTYINASMIKAGVKGAERAYIASQGPLEETSGDFWRMVWQQRARLVIMVARFVEHGREKVFQYLPLQPSEGTHEYDGVVRVRTLSVDDVGGGVVHRKVRVEHDGDERCIDHFLVAGWPDFGVPDSPGVMRSLVSVTHKCADGHALPRTVPIVVHCSAGIGRTGTYIACSALVDQIRAHTAAGTGDDLALSVFNEVHALRGQRMGSVQTPDQYAYVYSFLMRYLTDHGLFK